MTLWNRVVFVFELILSMAALVGLVRRGHARAAWLFVAFLSTTSIFDALTLAFPGPLFDWPAYLVRGTLNSSVRLGLAVELGVRIFGTLPRARANVSAAQLAITLGTFAAVSLNNGAEDISDLAVGVLPWLQYGTAFAFLVVLAAAAWYSVPLYPIHRAVLVAFTPYLMAFTFGIRATQEWGASMVPFLNYVDGVVFLAILAYWTREAWRPAPALAEDFPVAFRFLRPWAARRPS